MRCAIARTMAFPSSRIVRESLPRFSPPARNVFARFSQIAGILFLQHRPGEPAHFPPHVFPLITGLGFSGMTCASAIARGEKNPFTIARVEHPECAPFFFPVHATGDASRSTRRAPTSTEETPRPPGERSDINRLPLDLSFAASLSYSRSFP